MLRFEPNGHRREVDFGPPPVAARAFHRRLPGYAPGPLRALPGIAAELGLGKLWLKDESERFGLPAFKPLGASWACYRVCVERLGFEPAWTTLDELREAVAPLRPLAFVSATDGNHGRAVARVARWLGFEARIFVPKGTAAARISGIESEGATVTVVDGSYDDAVTVAAGEAGAHALVISDTSWPGYTQVPSWITEGYETIFAETDEALAAIRERQPDIVVVQIGVGALAMAAAVHYRQDADGPRMLGIEPETVACVLESVVAGEIVSVPGPHESLMAGLNCGTPSLIAWPVMRDAFDAFCSIDDSYVKDAMRRLAAAGVVSGETGASGLAAILALRESADAWASLGLDGSSVLVLSTEGATDPANYGRITGRTPEQVRAG